MNSTEIEKWIAYITERASMVHVGSSGAYEAFAGGEVIFDLSPNAELLEAFATQNASEFHGDQIERGADGKFRRMCVAPAAPPVFFTYHKHKAREGLVKHLQELESQ